MRWAYKGMDGTNSSIDIVHDYFDKKLLNELGHSFSDDLSIFEVQCYKIIHSELNKMEAQERKRVSRKR